MLGALDRIFAEEIARLTKQRMGMVGAATGAVGCPQRLGGACNVNPPLHTLCADGGFVKTDDGSVRFQAAPPPGLRPQGRPQPALLAVRRPYAKLPSWELARPEVTCLDDALVCPVGAASPSWRSAPLPAQGPIAFCERVPGAGTSDR